MEEQNKIEIYQSKDKQTVVEVKFEQETIWLSQKQMSELFNKDVRTINEHIKTIYKTEELIKNSTIRKFRIVQKEGKREVSREIEHYNLDMIISIGYRVNSIRGTQFRIWATQHLKDFLVKGYAINEKRLHEKRSIYPTIQEKAANLLYYIVKNHSFVDGNKRIAAACFLYFLDKNKALINQNNKTIISNEALASLTLFIATSKSEENAIVKRFIVSVLNRNLNNG